MDYLKKYKSFFYSYYLASGIRITAGLVLPSLLFNYFDMLGAGIAASLGALCVSTTDNPGPIHHRRNGMFICLLMIIVVTLFTGWAAPFPFLLGIVIFTSCFVFSIMGVYGSRAISIGVASLLIMVLQLARPVQGNAVWLQAVYVASGGLWYTLLSLALYNFRPYKLAQQALGECIGATADYLRIRAAFYLPDAEVNYEKSYRQMLEQQVTVHQQQDLVRELLFKSRNIVRAATPIGQTLVMLFSTLVDLFEQIMTAQQDARELHKKEEGAEVLQQYRALTLLMAEELDTISLAVKTGNPSEESDRLLSAIQSLKQFFDKTAEEKRTPGNVEYFIGLKQLLNSMDELAARIHTLHLYTTYNPDLPKPANPDDFEKFISHQDTSFSLLLDNLNMGSNYFRHALRVSIATIAGFIVSLFLHIGHSYWILLTIIVILKPAYSLTKKRNYERLTGTIAGALAGLLILYFVKDRTALFIIMLFLMVGTFSLIRTNYMVSVLMMTPYVLLLFHLINHGTIENIFTDRLIDTGIGSGIAFLANFFLVPVWERNQIKPYMVAALDNNRQYLQEVTDGSQNNTTYKVRRKSAFVALANLSDAFSRMLNEPGNRQAKSLPVNQFVVSMHLMTSHIATLSNNLRQYGKVIDNTTLQQVATAIMQELDYAKALLGDTEVTRMENSTAGQSVQQMEEEVRLLTQKRKAELEDGMLDTGTRKQLYAVKAIADQLSFIYRLSLNSKNNSLRLRDL